MAFQSLTNKEARAEYNRLQKAEKLYLKAVEGAGWKYVKGEIEKAIGTKKRLGDEVEEPNSKVRFSLKETTGGKKFVLIAEESIEELMNYKGDSLAAKVRSYFKQYRGTVLPLGVSDKAFMRREAEGEYTNPAKELSDEEYSDKLKAASELKNLLLSATFSEHKADNGRHPDAVRGWNYYNLNYVVPTLEGKLKAYSAEIQIKLIQRGDCFYDITKIKDITNGTAGQALIKAAGSVHGVSNNSIIDNSEKVNSNSQNNSGNIVVLQ